MKKIVQFEVYFEDLTETAQYYFCERFKTVPEKENMGAPLTIIDREIETEEEGELLKRGNE